MNGYAPNFPSSSGDSVVVLSAGLLARKGEAFPAVDANAHEGVDIDMRSLRPANSDDAPAEISEDTIGSLSKARFGAADNVEPFPVRSKNAAQDFHRAAASQPRTWSIIAPPVKSKPATVRPYLQTSGVMKATVKFRMTAREFIRLRLAARDLEMSPQNMLLEALECYLDANDITPLSDETYKRELACLAARMKQRGRP